MRPTWYGHRSTPENWQRGGNTHLYLFENDHLGKWKRRYHQKRPQEGLGRGELPGHLRLSEKKTCPPLSPVGKGIWTSFRKGKKKKRKEGPLTLRPGSRNLSSHSFSRKKKPPSSLVYQERRKVTATCLAKKKQPLPFPGKKLSCRAHTTLRKTRFSSLQKGVMIESPRKKVQSPVSAGPGYLKSLRSEKRAAGLKRRTLEKRKGRHVLIRSASERGKLSPFHGGRSPFHFPSYAKRKALNGEKPFEPERRRKVKEVLPSERVSPGRSLSRKCRCCAKEKKS